MISQAVELRSLDYPAWFVRLDEGAWRRVDHTPDGRIQVWIPPGLHQVTVRYQGTFAEQFGLMVSRVTALLLLIRVFSNLILKHRSRFV